MSLFKPGNAPEIVNYPEFFSMPQAEDVPYVPSKIPPCITTTGAGTSLFVPYNQSASISSFNTLYVSTLTGGSASFSTLTFSTATGTSASFSTLGVSSFTGNYANITSVSTNVISLDGNLLTTNTGGGGELLLNGIPIATTSNISSITDWSLYSAVSSINCATNDILNVGNIVGKTGDMSLSNVGTISFDVAGVRAIENLSTINGFPYSAGGGGGGNTISGTTTFDTADGGLTPSPAIATISAQNGLYGKVDISASAGTGGNSGGNVSITANGGSGGSGLYGQIDIIANQGSASGITTGGKINITANTGLSGGVPSAVNINAGGITVQSGFTVPIGSVGGYTFIGGNSGVNICGGSPSVIPNVPGTTYIYGTTGVEVGSDMYANNIFPYQYGILNGADLVIQGREYDIGLGNHIAYVNISTCKSIQFGGSTDVGDIGQIAGLSTINGQPYVPGGGVSDRITNASGSVIVGNVGQINITPAGVQPVIINGNITITNLDIAGVNSLQFNTIGPPSGQIVNLSTINGVAYAPAITNRASSTTPLLISATTSGTAITIGNLSMQTTIAGYDLDIFACIVFKTTNNSILDINCFITIDGVQVGQTFTSSISGANHYLTFPVQCSQLASTASTHTVLIKCYATNATDITMQSYQLTGIGNLA